MKHECREAESCQKAAQNRQDTIKCLCPGCRNKDGKKIQRMKPDDRIDVIPHPDRIVKAVRMKVAVKKASGRLSEPFPHIAKLENILRLSVPLPDQVLPLQQKGRKDKEKNDGKQGCINQQIFSIFFSITHRPDLISFSYSFFSVSEPQA